MRRIWFGARPNISGRLMNGLLAAVSCGVSDLIASQSGLNLSLEEAEGMAMASITILNLDDDVKTRLRVRAASNGRSMEEEARLFLRQAVESKAACRNLASAIRARIAPLGGVDLELPPREPAREPPTLD